MIEICPTRAGGDDEREADRRPAAVFKSLVCLVVVVALGTLVASVRRSELGQRMLAVRSNERAAAAVGIDVRGVKLTAFALSSFIAGIAGALYAYNFGSVTASRFGIVTALAFVAFAYLGGITTVSGALVGGMLVTGGLVIHAVNDWFGISTDFQLLVAGVALILTIMFNPVGIAGALTPAVTRFWTTIRRRGPLPAIDPPAATDPLRSGRP